MADKAGPDFDILLRVFRTRARNEQLRAELAEMKQALKDHDLLLGGLYDELDRHVRVRRDELERENMLPFEKPPASTLAEAAELAHRGVVQTTKERIAVVAASAKAAAESKTGKKPTKKKPPGTVIPIGRARGKGVKR